MQSLESLPSDTERSCYICLGVKGDLAPFCTQKESDDWVKPCQCSIVAHRKCFLSWVSSLDLEKRREQIASNTPSPMETDAATHTSVFSYSIQSLLFGLPLIKKSETINVFIDCPQCKRQICLQTPNSTVLNIRQTLDTTISNIMKVGISSSVISSSLASIGLGFSIALSATGVRVLQALTPQSVQLSLFDVGQLQANTLINALDKGLIPIPKFIVVTASIPLYLVYMRINVFGSGALNMLCEAFPLLLVRDYADLRRSPAKRFLLATIPLQFAYKALYSLTLNRIYYRWCKQVQPCFIADRLSLSELETIEQENAEEYEYLEHLATEEKAQQESDGSALGRFFHSIFSNPLLRHIRLARLRREIVTCFKFDYSKVFHNTHFYFFLASTLSWPHFGELVSRLLIARIPNINSFLNRFIRTPDEAVFLRNLMGCLVVVLVKDLLNLYFNYKKFKQLRDVDVVRGLNDDLIKYITDNYLQNTA